MRICFVGDSFVNGTGDEEYLGWPGRLCRGLREQGTDVTYYNLGIRRETSRGLRKRWEAEVKRRLDEAEDGRVVFSFGTNDTTILEDERRVGLSESIDNFRTVLTASLDRYPTLAMSPLPLIDSEQNQRTSKLTDEYAEVAKNIGLEYLNIFDEVRRGSVWMDSLRASDGYHPFAEGYEFIAKRIWEWDAWQKWVQ